MEAPAQYTRLHFFSLEVHEWRSSWNRQGNPICARVKLTVGFICRQVSATLMQAQNSVPRLWNGWIANLSRLPKSERVPASTSENSTVLHCDYVFMCTVHLAERIDDILA